MHPTLKSGELLLVDCDVLPLVGDIIVFDTPQGERFVHRIIKKEDSKIVTRGDNNRERDVFRIGFGEIFGVVVGIKRNRGIKEVHGGRRGLLISSFRNFFIVYRQFYVQPLLRFLHWKPVSQILSHFGTLLLDNRITLFKRNSGSVKLYYKKIVLGYYVPEMEEFRLRPIAQPLFSNILLEKLKKRIEVE